MNLDELKSRRKKFVSLALTADCGDDYWNDVDDIDKQIKGFGGLNGKPKI